MCLPRVLAYVPFGILGPFPPGGTSIHLATLGLDWGSRGGVWSIASGVPLIGGH